MVLRQYSRPSPSPNIVKAIFLSWSISYMFSRPHGSHPSWSVFKIKCFYLVQENYITYIVTTIVSFIINALPNSLSLKRGILRHFLQSSLYYQYFLKWYLSPKSIKQRTKNFTNGIYFSQ